MYRIEVKIGNDWAAYSMLFPSIYTAFLQAARSFPGKETRVVESATGRDVMMVQRVTQRQRRSRR